MMKQHDAVAELKCIRVLTPHEPHDLKAFTRWFLPHDEQEDETLRLLAGCCLHVCYTQPDPQLKDLVALWLVEPDELAELLMETAHTPSGPHAVVYDAGHRLICTPDAEQQRMVGVLKMWGAYHLDSKLVVGTPSEESTVYVAAAMRRGVNNEQA